MIFGSAVFSGRETEEAVGVRDVVGEGERERVSGLFSGRTASDDDDDDDEDDDEDDDDDDDDEDGEFGGGSEGERDGEGEGERGREREREREREVETAEPSDGGLDGEETSEVEEGEVNCGLFKGCSVGLRRGGEAGADERCGVASGSPLTPPLPPERGASLR